MQLGTRWTSGDEPPKAVPEALARGVREVDASLPGDALGVDRWTLTWLEGRPIAEADSGIFVTLDAQNHPIVRHEDDEDS
ncbi:hypothetical protein ACWPKO_20540 (plasmid) [Coraliomargarita sp. W4R53]